MSFHVFLLLFFSALFGHRIKLLSLCWRLPILLISSRSSLRWYFQLVLICWVLCVLPIPASAQAPFQPHGVTVANSVPTIFWGAVDGATHFELTLTYYTLPSGPSVNREVSASLCAGGSCTYTLDGQLPGGSQYNYRIRARGGAYDNEWVMGTFNVPVGSGTFVPTPLGSATALPSLDLLATSTPAVSNMSCPDGAWSPDGLDGQWANACSHCMPPRPTVTAGGIAAYPTLDRSQFAIGTPLFSTFTPPPVTSTVTPTSIMLTPTASHTPFAATRQYLYNDIGRSPQPVLTTGYNPNSGTYRLNVDGDTIIQDLGGWYFVNALQMYMYRNVSTAVRSAGDVYDQGGVLLTTFDLGSSTGNTPGGSSVYANFNLPLGGGSRWLREIRIVFRDSTGNLGGGAPDPHLHLGPITIGYGAGLPTPTPQFTATPSNTPTPEPTLFNNPILLIVADCRAPVYRDSTPAVDFSLLSGNQSVCYRVFPEISISQLSLEVAPVDVCFSYLEPTLSILGIVVDVQLIISAGLVFLLFRWALFN